MADGTLKICDFGLSHQFSNNEISTEIAGTVEYISPDMFYQQTFPFPKTFPNGRTAKQCKFDDWWSVGIVFFEMACGRTPWASAVGKNLNFLQRMIAVKKSMTVGYLIPHINLNKGSHPAIDGDAFRKEYLFGSRCPNAKALTDDFKDLLAGMLHPDFKLRLATRTKLLNHNWFSVIDTTFLAWISPEHALAERWLQIRHDPSWEHGPREFNAKSALKERFFDTMDMLLHAVTDTTTPSLEQARSNIQEQIVLMQHIADRKNAKFFEMLGRLFNNKSNQGVVNEALQILIDAERTLGHSPTDFQQEVLKRPEVQQKVKEITKASEALLTATLVALPSRQRRATDGEAAKDKQEHASNERERRAASSP